MKALALFVAALLPISSAIGTEEAKKNLKAFPAAKEGQERFIIELPHKERNEEGAFQVELIVGKTISTDGVNRQFMGGEIKTMPLKGWGFTFYEVEKAGPVGGTLIGVPKGTPTVDAFVQMRPLKIRYNSRLPVVVYVPKGMELRYRIWKAGEETLEAAKG